MNEPPICKNCKWIERWVPICWQNRLCLHPDSARDPVSGRRTFAEIRRHYDKLCDNEGKQWESR